METNPPQEVSIKGKGKGKETNPPPILCILTYCDQTLDINIVKFYCFSNMVELTHPRHKAKLYPQYQNKSLKDLLVSTVLHQWRQELTACPETM